MIRKTLIALAVAAAFSAVAQGQEQATPSWSDYRATVNPSVKIDDSFNRSSDVRTAVEVDDSFNRRTETNTETNIDKSKTIKDSYNTDKSRKAVGSYNTDNSKKAVDSFNTDNSHKAVDSYNTDLRVDTQTVNPDIKSVKYQETLDTQTASNSSSMYGARQTGMQGGFQGGNIDNSSAPAITAIGTGRGSRVHMVQDRELAQSNSAAIYGPNLGAVSNTNVAHQGDGDLTLGPKGSIVGSRLGNDQTFLAGDQTQVQGNEQQKQSQTSSNASDTTVVKASK